MWWSHSHFRARASMAAMEVPLESERDDYTTHDYGMGDLERESTMDENAAVEDSSAEDTSNNGNPPIGPTMLSYCPTLPGLYRWQRGHLLWYKLQDQTHDVEDLLPSVSFDSAFNYNVILLPIQQLVSDHQFNGVLNGLYIQVRGWKHGCVSVYAATDNKPSKVRWQKLWFSGRATERVRAIYNSAANTVSPDSSCLAKPWRCWAETEPTVS
ncbi:hypothetical protein NXS19_004135 [Fusarium pseudograminearum]|nr:hypothetical protein FPSE5266_01198 [Fusarium pseudograminearum]UZP36319.1 hypothetical protein NXS19_004135 [Fusarium pseudograminearum]